MRPIAVEDTYDTFDETGTWNHQSEILVPDAFWLGSVQGTRATIVTFFNEDEKYTWKTRIEFDTTDRHKYNIYSGESNNYAIQRRTLFYNQKELQLAQGRLHNKYLEDPTAVTYAVFENIGFRRARRPTFEVKDPIPENFKQSDNWSDRE